MSLYDYRHLLIYLFADIYLFCVYLSLKCIIYFILFCLFTKRIFRCEFVDTKNEKQVAEANFGQWLLRLLYNSLFMDDVTFGCADRHGTSCP